MKNLFQRPTDYLIAAFIVGLALMLGFCESAKADWSAEIIHDSTGGVSSYNGGFDRICGRFLYANDTTSMYYCPLVGTAGKVRTDQGELGIGEKFGRWEADIRLAYVREETWGGASVRRMVGDGPFQMGIGMSYWITESPGSNSQVTFNLVLRYTF